GHVSKPGSRWIDGGTQILLGTQLSIDSQEGESRVIAVNGGDSNTVQQPKDIEKIQSGKVAVEVTLRNSDYYTDVINGRKIAEDALVNIQVRCELLREPATE